MASIQRANGNDILIECTDGDEQKKELRGYFINRLNEHALALRKALFPNGQPERGLMQ